MAISGTYAAGDEVVLQDMEIEVDLTPVSASAFAAMESWSSEIAINGGDVPTNLVYLFKATGPVVLTGNRTPFTLEVTALYTEDATDPFKNIWDKHEDPSGNYASDLRAMDVRWSPKGGSTGNFQYTTTGGKLTNCSLPQGDAEGDEPSTFVFTIECQSIAQGTAA